PFGASCCFRSTCWPSFRCDASVMAATGLPHGGLRLGDVSSNGQTKAWPEIAEQAETVFCGQTVGTTVGQPLRPAESGRIHGTLCTSQGQGRIHTRNFPNITH